MTHLNSSNITLLKDHSNLAIHLKSDYCDFILSSSHYNLSSHIKRERERERDLKLSGIILPSKRSVPLAKALEFEVRKRMI